MASEPPDLEDWKEARGAIDVSSMRVVLMLRGRLSISCEFKSRVVRDLMVFERPKSKMLDRLPLSELKGDTGSSGESLLFWDFLDFLDLSFKSPLSESTFSNDSS